jgi:spoIIIJ-associated protein
VDAKCKTVKSEDPHLQRMVIEGADTAILIGRRGDTLDALQYLCSLVVNKGEKEYTRVSIDTENYRKKREAALTQLAKRIAGKVARTGRPVKLEPMNPYERRILHYALQNHPKVETVSEGEDPFRRVTVRLKRKNTEDK